MDAAAATALVVACAESSLPSKAEDLLVLAEKLGRAADRCGVPKTKLVAAADNLSRAEEPTRLEAVRELGRAASAMGEEAATLARACEGFGHLVGAIRAVRTAAEEEAARPRGFAGRIRAWWAKRRQSKNGGVPDPEAPLLAKDLSSSHSHKGVAVADLSSAGQGQVRMAAIQGFALFRSIALLPYMGPDGALKPASSDYRWGVLVVFTLWWTLVGVGVLCSYAKTKFEPQFAQLSSRAGMSGINFLVILFSSWLLAPDATSTLWALLSFAALLHFASFISAWVHEDI